MNSVSGIKFHLSHLAPPANLGDPEGVAARHARERAQLLVADGGRGGGVRDAAGGAAERSVC